MKLKIEGSEIMNDNIASELMEIIKNVLKEFKPDVRVSLEDDLKSLGINSLTFIKIAVTAESQFGIEFGENDLNFMKFNKVIDLEAYIENRLKDSSN
jgi:acyl carrier protein